MLHVLGCITEQHDIRLVVLADWDCRERAISSNNTGGRLMLHSAPGISTTAEIFFPLAALRPVPLCRIRAIYDLPQASVGYARKSPPSKGYIAILMVCSN